MVGGGVREEETHVYVCPVLFKSIVCDRWLRSYKDISRWLDIRVVVTALLWHSQRHRPRFLGPGCDTLTQVIMLNWSLTHHTSVSGQIIISQGYRAPLFHNTLVSHSVV